MSYQQGVPEAPPSKRVRLLIVAGLVAFVAAIVLAAVIGAVYGLRARDGSGRLACAVTGCDPAAIELSGLVTALFPVVWCGVYALCFRRLRPGGRVAGAVITVLLLLSTSVYWPTKHEYREPLSTTENGARFMHGMGLGVFAVIVDVVLFAPLLTLISIKRSRRVPTPVWAAVLAAPIALSAAAAVTHPVQ